MICKIYEVAVDSYKQIRSTYFGEQNLHKIADKTLSGGFLVVKQWWQMWIDKNFVIRKVVIGKCSAICSTASSINYVCSHYSFRNCEILSLWLLQVFFCNLSYSRFPCCVLSYFSLAFATEQMTNPNNKSQLSKTINYLWTDCLEKKMDNLGNIWINKEASW